MQHVPIYKIIKYLKIAGGCMAAFFIAQLLVRHVFISYSPEVRPRLGTYIATQYQRNKAKLNPLAWFSPQKEQQRMYSRGSLEQVSQYIAPGVKAATDDGISYTEFTLDEVEWIRYTYTNSEGEKVEIEVPKGHNVPFDAEDSSLLQK